MTYIRKNPCELCGSPVRVTHINIDHDNGERWSECTNEKCQWDRVDKTEREYEKPDAP